MALDVDGLQMSPGPRGGVTEGGSAVLKLTSTTKTTSRTIGQNIQYRKRILICIFQALQSAFKTLCSFASSNAFHGQCETQRQALFSSWIETIRNLIPLLFKVKFGGKNRGISSHSALAGPCIAQAHVCERLKEL